MRRINNRNRREQRRGAALVEFAVVAPLMATLVIGTIEVGAALRATTILSAAVREGGRLASMEFSDKLGPNETACDKVKRDVRNFATAAGLDGCEALVTHGAAGEVSSDVLKISRQRSDEDWAAANDSLRSRGWLGEAGELTDLGREQRGAIEDRTDELAVAPYAALGEDACAELRTLARPTSKLMAAALGF